MPSDDIDPAEERASRLAGESLAAGDPIGWFERLYAGVEQAGIGVPWDRGSPNRLLVGWTQTHGLAGQGRRALVVGCGLGDDAEHIASLGFDTTAFDVAPSAIREARRRYPRSTVDYTQADLLDPPAGWRGALDLVVESITVQALPPALHEQATHAVTAFVAPGGTLLVIAARRDQRDGAQQGPPWPLTRHEIDAFANGDLEVVGIEEIADPGVRRWRATFCRPSD